MFISPDNLPNAFQPILELAEHEPRAAVIQAQAFLQQTCADDVMMYSWACYTLGWAWLRWERLTDARLWLTQSQDAWLRQENQLASLHCRRALLMTATLGGTGRTIQADWDLLVEHYGAAGHTLDAARARLQQIEHLTMLVDAQQAGALAKQVAAAIQTLGTVADRALLLYMQASIASDLGNQEQAIEQITTAAQMFADAGHQIDVARCYRKRAWFCVRLEQFAHAMDDLRRAEATFDRLELPIHQALCKRTAAIIAAYRGDYARALAETYQARQAFIALDRRDAVVDCDMTLGNVAYHSAQYDLALAWYRQAQAAYTTLGSLYLTFVSQRNQALVLQARGEPQQSFALLARLETVVRMLDDPGEEAEMILLQGQTLMDMADYENALSYIVQAQARFVALENYQGAARAVLAQGYVYLAQQRPALAVSCFHHARIALVDRPTHTWRIAYGLGRCAQIDGDLDTALRQYQEASSIIAGLRRTFASEHASSGFFSLASQLFSDALTVAAMQDNLTAMVMLVEQQRAITLQRQIAHLAWHVTPDVQPLYDQQIARLRQAIARDASLQELDETLTVYMQALLPVRHTATQVSALPELALDLDHLRAQFTAIYPAGWSVLLYARCGDQLFIITWDSSTLNLTRTLCDAQLYHLLYKARLWKYGENVYRDFARLHNPSAPPWRVPLLLAERLIPDDVRARLHPDMRLLIIPTEPLHALPWAALRVGDAWLCEQATLQVLPALALWEPLHMRVAPGNDALLIGCSHFGSRASDLPNMAAEQELVTRIWQGTITRLTNADATRQAVLDMAARGDLQRYGLVHITSHARLVAARGLLAHVKLWDTDMLLDDIAGLGLVGALVVLATCDGIASEVLPGDEVLNLGHAFLSGGARDVIASIWPFFDSATHEVLMLLYTELVRGIDAPTALARAQRAFIARYAHLGDHRPVEYSPMVWGGLLAIGAGTEYRSTSGALLVSPVAA